ncbi:unnamed protein product [Symbiodinium sp. CCMP2456]|nr:unnamed protein product [Symbiodinium sp. CCMP2456]
MSISLQVSLLSGRTICLDAELGESLQSLSDRAQVALASRRGSFLNAEGKMLHGASTVEDCCLKDGDVLTFHMGQIEVFMSRGLPAAASILSDGSLVAWGEAESGGDCSFLTDQLKNVRKIQGSQSAFAVLLADSSVVTWGDKRCGGDSSAVQHKLQKVEHIQASNASFAALLNDGSVVTWGDAAAGGDSSSVHDQLKNLSCSAGAFKAFLG